MKISVKVKANSKQEKIEKLDSQQFLVWVKARPQMDKANQAVAEVLAEYFSVAKSNILLIKGRVSKQKVFEVKP